MYATGFFSGGSHADAPDVVLAREFEPNPRTRHRQRTLAYRAWHVAVGTWPFVHRRWYMAVGTWPLHVEVGTWPLCWPPRMVLARCGYRPSPGQHWHGTWARCLTNERVYHSNGNTSQKNWGEAQTLGRMRRLPNSIPPGRILLLCKSRKLPRLGCCAACEQLQSVSLPNVLLADVLLAGLSE